MSSFASPKVWEEPTEVTHEGGNAFENLLVPRKSAFFHGFFGRKSPNPCLFLQIQMQAPFEIFTSVFFREKVELEPQVGKRAV